MCIPLSEGSEEDKQQLGMKAEQENHNLYNKKLKRFAGQNRKRMTKAEACLWKFVLKAGSMKGYTFNRQRPVMNYIADFMSKDLKLIIEVDGYSHLLEEVIKKDIKRQKDLEDAGFTVLRFTDNDVLKNIQNVKLSIEQTIEEIERDKTSPCPLSEGDIGKRVDKKLPNDQHI